MQSPAGRISILGPPECTISLLLRSEEEEEEEEEIQPSGLPSSEGILFVDCALLMT